MRSIFLFLSLVLVAQPAAAFDKRTHRLGLGVELGDPTGLTAKYYLDRHMALQGGLGLYAWPFGPGGHLDFLYEFPKAVDTAKESFDLPVYLGAGLKAGGYYHCRARRAGDACWYRGFAGLRVPVGAAVQLKKTPLEFQLEVAPVFYGGWFWWWGFGAELDASLSARYYF